MMSEVSALCSPGRGKLAAVLVTTTMLSSPAAEAQPSAEDTAGAHYDEAVKLSVDGELDLALAEFERAYAAMPRAAVLFNIGQLQFALGQPVEAKRTLERFLAEGQEVDSGYRAAQARRTLELCNRRIGMLEIRTQPSDAEITVDGRAVGTGAGDLTVAAGPHAVLVARKGYTPVVRHATVAAGAVQRVEVRLSRHVEALGWVHLACHVPGVTVIIDGLSPLAGMPDVPLPLEPGPRTVRFERRGYEASEFRIVVEQTKVRQLECALVPLSKPSPDDTGELVLQGVPRGARVEIDGAPSTAALVPIGPHWVTVTAPGYVPWSREVAVIARGRQTVALHLDLTQQERHRRFAEWQTKRTLGYLSGGAGFALGAAAVATYALNSARHDEWRAKRDSIQSAQDWNESWANLSEQASGIQRIDDIAFGLGLAGGALIATSVYFFLTSEKPREPAVRRSSRRARRSVTAWEW